MKQVLAAIVVLVFGVASMTMSHATPHDSGDSGQHVVEFSDHHDAACDDGACNEADHLPCCAMMTGNCSSFSALLGNQGAELSTVSATLRFTIGDTTLRDRSPDAELPPPRS
ncbi:MAG: hypothetical protein RIC87_13225 [Kiloniellales bacterium]